MLKQNETKIPEVADNLCLDIAKKEYLRSYNSDVLTRIRNAGDEDYNYRYKDEELYWAINNYLAGSPHSKEVKLNMPKIHSLLMEGQGIGQHLLEVTNSHEQAKGLYEATCILLETCGIEYATIMAKHWYDALMNMELEIVE